MNVCAGGGGGVEWRLEGKRGRIVEKSDLSFKEDVIGPVKRLMVGSGGGGGELGKKEI